MTLARYGTYRWKQTRKYVLARDGYRCMLRMKGCTGRATQADHIIDVADGGSDDPSNCQAACQNCNNAKKWERYRRRQRRGSDLQRWDGPPASQRQRW